MITKAQLLRYLRGQMGSAERLAFEEQLPQEPHWQNVVDTFDQSGFSADEIETHLNTIVARQEQRMEMHTPWLRLLGRVAAVLLVTVSAYSVWQYYQAQAHQRQYASYLEATENSALLSVRGEGDELSDEFKMAMRAYQAQTYERSYQLFESLREADPFHQPTLQMTARSAMQLGDYYTAEQLLDQSLLLNATPAEHAAARWHLALVYLQLEEPQRARALLTELSDTSRGQYGEQARKLLDEMNK